MKRITTTIKRHWLDQIVAGNKKVEHRESKDYWRGKLVEAGLPFELRLIYGMSKTAPEATVLVDRVRESLATGELDLHIARIIGRKHWDAKRRQPR